jgi:hypothetical protein
VIKRPGYCTVSIECKWGGDVLVPYACASIVHIWFVTLSCDHRLSILVCFDHPLATIELLYASMVNNTELAIGGTLIKPPRGAERLSHQMESHQLSLPQGSEELLVCPFSKH